MKLSLSQTQFESAARRAEVAPEIVNRLWLELSARAAATPEDSATAERPANAPTTRARFDFAHVAYYFGAVVVLGAMGWWMNRAWETFGGVGVCAIALGYAAAFVGLGRWLGRREETRTPAGLLFTLAVGMTPLAVYGFERAVGWWPQEDPGAYADFHVWVRGGWAAMELTTVTVAALALRRVRFPFLTAPLAFALWYLSMDLTPLLFGGTSHSWERRQWVSVAFGLVMMLVALGMDVRRRWRGTDYGFWLSLFGLMAFWGGLTSMDSRSEWGRLVYGLINLGLLGFAVAWDRRAFAVFGGLGICGYLGHLAFTVFRDSALFPFALSGFGLAVIAFGVLYQRQRHRWRRAALARVPAGWRGLLPPEPGVW